MLTLHLMLHQANSGPYNGTVHVTNGINNISLHNIPQIIKHGVKVDRVLTAECESTKLMDC